MNASALVYLTSLHPDRELLASRGGPSGEMAMSSSLVAGLSELGLRVDPTGTLRRFLRRRALQVLRRTPPDIAFFDPWSLALAARYRAWPRQPRVPTYVLEWFGTTEAAIPDQTYLPPRNYLVPYPYPDLQNRFLGFMLPSGKGAYFTSATELRTAFVRSRQTPRTYGLVWGKDPRYFGARERSLVQTLATRVPMHLTVDWGSAPPLTGDGILNHGHKEPEAWRALLRGARFVLGLGDPILGPTALEALAAGAVLLNPSFKPARSVEGNPGVSFDSQHTFAGTIGPPHVLSIDLAQPERVTRIVDDLLAHPPEPTEPLPRGLEEFTRDAYLSRLAALLPSRIQK